MAGGDPKKDKSCAFLSFGIILCISTELGVDFVANALLVFCCDQNEDVSNF